ncbi:HD domain-containing protein [Amycolatopsis regifaucium]|uniref:Phosphohydrolase n=1 Tax=Amycolatopsis regifaucium TaxID=546365 RepID=A0A154MT38_9PSEU|nr:HD domain-containing protein [Amycolatopsis regifaucium]KZB87425.1 phosphohydrolase [Amycolatopsis regifaucium]OKA08262.1 phosphohydrolase [Amycolatopsis regifaucium]SFJ72515.1 HD domain-containing protein [Amycolatopsis regifaucium]
MELTKWANGLADLRLAERLPLRWKHVQGVRKRLRVTEQLFSTYDVDLLAAAGILHDIGYAPELAGAGLHALDGARYLREVEAPERLCALVAHHSAAYLEAELRGLADELGDWTDERTPLRDALWWADMTTSPDGEVVTFEERAAEIQERYGPDDVVSTFIQLARPELAGAVERTEARLRAAGIDYV